MILKPSPDDVIDQYLASLEAIGIDLSKHDIKFEEDNWESPTLGAWGIGWQVMLDGLEITQFTYFQQCGGIDLDLVPAELTYGLERLVAFLQGVESVYDIEWAPGVKYADVRFADELQNSVYNFEMANVDTLWKLFATARRRGPAPARPVSRSIRTKARFPLLAAYDHVLKCSNYFNLLDARGAISVTERVGVIARVRKLAVGVAQIWVDQQAPAAAEVSRMSDFLLEIGTEEIPDWMIEPALADLAAAVHGYVTANSLLPSSASVTSSTRPRAAWCCEPPALQPGRPTKRRTVTGPPISAGEGAAKGFAKKNSVPFEALVKSATAEGRVLHPRAEGRGPRSARICSPKRYPASSPASSGPRRCTGPARTARASSAPSAGSSRCSAIRWSRSRLPV